MHVRASNWHANTTCSSDQWPKKTVTWGTTLARYRQECKIPSTHLAIVVLTRREDIAQREMVRKTWGWQRKWVWFVVSGTPCGEPVNDVSKWACKRPGKELAISEPDVVNVASVESYRGLPRQLKLAYGVVQKNVVADWVIKMDIDSGADLFNLKVYLDQLNVGNVGKMMVYGNIAVGWGVHRSGKWAELKYPEKQWPKFPVGSFGHVLTRAAYDEILNTNGVEYQGEDVSVGIWLKPHPVRWVHAKLTMRNDGQCHRGQSFVIGHNMDTRKIQSCYARRGYIKKKLIGGLGNQLFQWASVVGIAQRNNMNVCFVRSTDVLLRVFPHIELPECPSATWYVLREKGFGVFQPFEIPKDIMHVEIVGYLQSWKYFVDVKMPQLHTDLIASGKVHTRAPPGSNVCAIHARRGDLLDLHYVKFPPNLYFERAVKEHRCTNVFVFTDNVEWATKFGPFYNATVVSETRTGVAFAALVTADTLITSVGTFGWWAGYLGKSQRTVYRYGNEFSHTHKISAGNVDPRDYYNPRVIELTADVNTWGHHLPPNKETSDWCPTKGSAGGAFVQSLYTRAAQERVSTCTSTQRIGGSRDGGKLICTDRIRHNNCTVYSLGSRLDFTFEIDVVNRFGCDVFTFDCTVGAPKNIPQGVQFYPWCISNISQRAPMTSDMGQTGYGQYYTLSIIQEYLGHNHIDLLKMDIERHEFAVIASLTADIAPYQIAFETHLHNAYGAWGRPVCMQEWLSLWAKLDGLGYKVFAHEPNPLCVCCCEFSIMTTV